MMFASFGFTEFEKKDKKEACPVLEQLLCHIAKTGQPVWVSSRTGSERSDDGKHPAKITTFLPRFRLPWSQFKAYFMFKLEKVMDGFCASAPQQGGPQNPNVDYVPYEQMKGRILKIVDDFHGWVKVPTSADCTGVESVAHACIFLGPLFPEFHSPYSVCANSSQTQSETTRESTSFSWAWRRWARLSVSIFSVFWQHTGMFRDGFHFYAECDGGQLHLLHIRVRPFKIYHFCWAVFEPFKASLQWFIPSHLQNQTLCVSCSFKGKIGPPV